MVNVPLFDPRPDEEFVLHFDQQETWFRAVAHSKGPSFVHAMEGAKATVYRIAALGNDDDDYALKVMKPK